ncbi:YybH family protein [Embleya sp. AB8]|uniref:YybH family protein n=1 Tax=Embleya sp. AB8 TaxID=3156304 RepID=UPI003C7242DF
MPARTPQDLHTDYAAAFNAGDLDTLAACYEDAAVFTGTTGRLHGVAAIRAHLADLLAHRPIFRLHTRDIAVTGDLALLSSDWRFTSTTPTDAAGDTRVDTTGTSFEVARRQPDGTWRYVIDEPSPLART